MTGQGRRQQPWHIYTPPPEPKPEPAGWQPPNPLYPRFKFAMLFSLWRQGYEWVEYWDDSVDGWLRSLLGERSEIYLGDRLPIPQDVEWDVPANKVVAVLNPSERVEHYTYNAVLYETSKVAALIADAAANGGKSKIKRMSDRSHDWYYADTYGSRISDEDWTTPSLGIQRLTDPDWQPPSHVYVPLKAWAMTHYANSRRLRRLDDRSMDRELATQLGLPWLAHGL